MEANWELCPEANCYSATVNRENSDYKLTADLKFPYLGIEGQPFRTLVSFNLSGEVEVAGIVNQEHVFYCDHWFKNRGLEELHKFRDQFLQLGVQFPVQKDKITIMVDSVQRNLEALVSPTF